MSAVYREVLRRRLTALAGRSETALREVGTRPHPAGRSALRAVLAAMSGTFFELAERDGQGHPGFTLILARCLTEPVDCAEELLAREYHPVLARWAREIRRHSVAMPPSEFMWRFSFVVGALHHSLATIPRMQPLTQGLCPNHDYASAREHFADFAEAVFVGKNLRNTT